MRKLFETYQLGGLELANRFVLPPIKTAFGTPQGNVTERHLSFYGRIARRGPGLLIIEPVSVTPEGKEHPKQLCIHLPNSVGELREIVGVIHRENRLAALHLNHAGAAANPKATGGPPKAPSPVTCPTTGQTAEALTEAEIGAILEGYRSAAAKAVEAGFDMIEFQGGHGYLISQFLNPAINQRSDEYGQNRLLFAREALAAIHEGAPDLPCILRVSGNEMSPEFGLPREDLASLLALCKDTGVRAVHVGMGSACFSPPWYFHHGSLPEGPQIESVKWVRDQTSLPVILAGRMGRIERVRSVMDDDLADLVAIGRPLIADPELIEKWEAETVDEVRHCGYCLQGCLHRVKTGEPIGCNLNPEIGRPELKPVSTPMTVLVAGGGPAGMSAALYLSKRGHRVTLAEQSDRLGGQFNLAWQAPGKEMMRDGLTTLVHQVRETVDSVMTGRAVDADLVREISPGLLVWAVGAKQQVPQIEGLDSQYTLTSLDYFGGTEPVKGPRVLVIGAGRTGLEIAEKLGKSGFNVVATKRTDPIGSMMEMITKKLTLMRIEGMPNITLMPHTAVTAFKPDRVEMTQDGEPVELPPFQTVILATGMTPAPGPDPAIRETVPSLEIIGDAGAVMDIYTAVHAGYETALRY